MSIIVSNDIQAALACGEPVVALETAVLTSGLPKIPWSEEYGSCPKYIDTRLPINVALAKAMTHAVQSNGAIPAWIAVVAGTLRIGLSNEEIVELCNDTSAGKVSLATLSQTMQNKQSAGTTVAATLLGCRLASNENPIRVFATGGIGGIHQNWVNHPDISADLTALATTPTCVIASGAKSILDIPATVESLETIGVPVLGLGNGLFPRFIEKNSEGDPSVYRVDSPEEIASICNHQWVHLRMNSAVLVTIPAPLDVALERGILNEALKQAELDWEASNQPSTTRTPFLLDQMAKITDGKSLLANLALLCNNAGAAAKISVAFASNV